MVYIEYYKCKKEYEESYNRLRNYIDKKTMLFIRTMPSAVVGKEVSVQGGIKTNPFEEYMQKKEALHIDEAIIEAKAILNEKKVLLDNKEIELRKSKDWYDIIYCYYFVDKLTIRSIARRIPYSPSQTGKIIKKIRQNLKMRQNETKSML